MVKYELQNIVPYNDIYYIDCANLSFFTAVKHFDGSAFSYIVNDCFVYVLEQTEKGLSLKIDKLSALPSSEIDKFNCIDIEYIYDYESDITDSIINTVSRDGIAIIPMDGFYYRHPFHDLFYLKEHHNQVMLVYGFDCEKKIFKTVDVNGFEWNSKKCCYKHEMSFEDMAKCHDSIVNCQMSTRAYTRITKGSSNKTVTDDPLFYKSTMIKNLKLYKTEILKGLQNICTLADNIEQFDIDKTTVFNNKVVSLSNKYKIMSALGNEFSNYKLMEEINNGWMVIEALIYKADLNGINNKKKFSSKLNQLFELESTLYEELFFLFNKLS
jgi:rRNA-processing protein FCF1